jgi:hypothetical protein
MQVDVGFRKWDFGFYRAGFIIEKLAGVGKPAEAGWQHFQGCFPPAKAGGKQRVG